MMDEKEPSTPLQSGQLFSDEDQKQQSISPDSQDQPMPPIPDYPSQNPQGQPMPPLQGYPPQNPQGRPMPPMQGYPPQNPQGLPMPMQGYPPQNIQGRPMPPMQGYPPQNMQGQPMPPLQGYPPQNPQGRPMPPMQGYPPQNQMPQPGYGTGTPKCKSCGAVTAWTVEPLFLTKHIIGALVLLLFFGFGLLYLLIIAITRSDSNKRAKICPICGARNQWTFV